MMTRTLILLFCASTATAQERKAALPEGAIARLGSLSFRHAGIDGADCRRVGMSADGRTIVTTSRHLLRCWNADGNLRWERQWAGDEIAGVALASSGKLVAVRGDARLELIDGESGVVRHSFSGWRGPRSASNVTFSADGKTLAVVTQMDGVIVFDVASTKELFRTPSFKDPNAWVTVVTDRRELVMTDRNVIRRYDVATRGAAPEVNLQGFGTWYEFAPDGETLCLTSVDKVIALRFVDTRTGRDRLRVDATRESSNWLHGAFVGDSKSWLSVTRSAQRRSIVASVIELEKGRETRRVELPDQLWCGVAADANAETLAIARSDFGLSVWDAKTGKETSSGPLHLGTVTAIEYSPDGSTLVSGSSDGRLQVWDAMTGRHRRSLRPHVDAIKTLRCVGESTVVSCSGDAVTLQNWRTGQLEGTIRVAELLPKGAIPDEWDGASLTADRTRIVALANRTRSPKVYVFDRSSRQVVARHEMPWRSLYSVGRSDAMIHGMMWEGNEVIPHGRGDAFVRTIDPMTGNVLSSFRLPQGYNLCHCSDDRRILLLVPKSIGGPEAAGIDPSAYRLWETHSNRPTVDIPRRNDAIANTRWTAMSLKQMILGHGGTGTPLFLVDLTTGKSLGDLPDVGDSRCAAFHPGGKHLAVGYADGTALIWNVESKLPKSELLELTPQRWEEWWAKLLQDGATAYRAMFRLITTGDAAVDRLDAQLKLDHTLTPEQARKLIAALDDMRFATRQAAGKELERYGEQAAPHLEAARLGTITAEQRRRVASLLALGNDGVRGESLRALRAVEVLERIGTPKSRAVLQRLAAGAPNARLTKDAAAALGRLQ